MNLTRILRDRLAERATFGCTQDWLLSLYDRALNRLKNPAMPGWHRLCRVAVRAFDAPVALRLGTTDWLVLNELVANDEYREVFAAGLGPVKQIIDLGANIGLSVRLWRARYPDAYVVAVEPSEENALVLEENIRLAKAGEFVTVERACAMGYVRPVELQGSANGEWAFAAHDVAESNLKVVTMMELIEKKAKEKTVDLLKCDIEGAEAELFERCGDWMPRVRHVVVELHAPYTVKRLEADLQKNGVGYRMRHQHEAGDLALVLFSNTAYR